MANGHGGKRSGAGRKPGTAEPLPRGVPGVIRALRFRVPKDAPPDLAKLADETLEIGAALIRKTSVSAEERNRLAAVAWVREQICGKPAQPVELTGKDGSPLSVVVNVLPPEDT